MGLKIPGQKMLIANLLQQLSTSEQIRISKPKYNFQVFGVY